MNKRSTHHFIAFIAVAFLFLQACSAPEKKPDVKEGEPVEEVIVEQPDTVLFWTVDNTNKFKTRVYKDTVAISDPESVVNGINTLYPAMELKFIKKSGDTIYARVDSSAALSSQVGSFGAQEYISAVVLNLTTLDSINFVNLDFQEGSHAAPGVFSKNSYAAFKEKE